MNTLVWIALLLVIVWVVLRLALAVTSGVLHLLWLAAIVMFVVWLVGKIRGGPGAA